MERRFKVIFQPSGRRGEIEEGKTVLDASKELGVEIESLCGGNRACGKCRIKLEEGTYEKYGITSSSQHLSAFSDEEGKFITPEEKGEGYRLSCVAEITGDVLIFIPEESRAEKQVIRKAATDRRIELNPAIKLYAIDLIAPSFQDPLGDFERLKNALLEKVHLPSLDIAFDTLLKLSRALRKGKWKVTVAVWMDREIIDVKPGRVEEAYGVAVDVGTTTVAAYLCNLQTGKLVSTHSMMNPQVIFGEDVMSRITFVMAHPEDGL